MISKNYKVLQGVMKLVMSNKLVEMFSEEEINAKIRELGKKISEDYAGQEVTLVCILKGASMFTCELAKRITIPVRFEFMQISSYGNETESSGVVKIMQDLDEPIRGRNVLVCEDIIDSGRSMHYLMDILKGRGPADLKLCSLLDKPDRRVVDVNIDYKGFTIPDKFIVGFGLDYAQEYRNLPYIAEVIPE